MFVVYLQFFIELTVHIICMFLLGLLNVTSFFPWEGLVYVERSKAETQGRTPLFLHYWPHTAFSVYRALCSVSAGWFSRFHHCHFHVYNGIYHAVCLSGMLTPRGQDPVIPWASHGVLLTGLTLSTSRDGELSQRQTVCLEPWPSTTLGKSIFVYNEQHPLLF